VKAISVLIKRRTGIGENAELTNRKKKATIAEIESKAVKGRVNSTVIDREPGKVEAGRAEKLNMAPEPRC
jgi:hypothetical protein